MLILCYSSQKKGRWVMLAIAPQKQTCLPTLREAWVFYSNKHKKGRLICRAEKKLSESPDISFDELLRVLGLKLGSSGAHFVVNYLYHTWEYKGEGPIQSLSPRGVLLALWYFTQVKVASHQECMSSVSEFYLTSDDVRMYMWSHIYTPQQ